MSSAYSTLRTAKTNNQYTQKYYNGERPKQDMIVRHAQPEDASDILETLRNLTEVGDLPKKQAQQLLLQMQQQDSHVFVAVKEEQVVGCCTILIEQKIIHQGGLVGHIEDVATRKGYERQGIGRAVVSAAVTYARERGCYKVILDCSEEVAGFYEKMGFYKKELCMRLDTQNL